VSRQTEGHQINKK